MNLLQALNAMSRNHIYYPNDNGYTQTSIVITFFKNNLVSCRPITIIGFLQHISLHIQTHFPTTCY